MLMLPWPAPPARWLSPTDSTFKRPHAAKSHRVPDASLNSLATPDGFVPDILEENLGFVRSPMGLTLSAELDGISFLAGEVPGAWTLRAWWYYGRTAGSDERLLPARMPAIALEAEVFRIWRLANPNMKVPALLAAGADYVAWQAARARASAC